MRALNDPGRCYRGNPPQQCPGCAHLTAWQQDKPELSSKNLSPQLWIRPVDG